MDQYPNMSQMLLELRDLLLLICHFGHLDVNGRHSSKGSGRLGSVYGNFLDLFDY
jgi:hypothetical protein